MAGVKERYDQFPQVIKPVLDSIQAISEHCEAELTKLHHLQSSTTTSVNLSEADIYKRLNVSLCIHLSWLVFNINHRNN